MAGDEDLRTVRELPHVWIPMSDGARLAARIWLPEDADELPVPAVLEYIPYRKNDGTHTRDLARQPYLAAHGYAAVRVDLRGTGDSDGLLLDEYLQQELDDACEVIAWLAAQPWCTGNVGMAGISWGGFNALQVAAMRPPALKAIISVCSTDDRYADDVHYLGGCVVGSDMLPWASTMLVADARPPDPLVVGEAWREAWLERLDVPPFVEAWLTHQRRDDYWRHGSVIEDHNAMDCAVLMVGGWDDAYRDAVLRVLEGYSGPRKGLIGPWGHTYPDRGVPGARIDFLAESVRFLDHWLAGVDRGVMDEPMLRTFIGHTEPGWRPTDRPGTWMSEPSWPSPNVAPQRWSLGPGSLLPPGSPGSGDPSPGDAVPSEPTGHRLILLGRQTAGLDAGAYMGRGIAPDLPGDQAREDGLSLCFTSEPLTEALTILGCATVELEVVVDRPNAAIAVRLCELTPGGTSRLVARGMLDLTHRGGHEEPVAMVPGRPTVVTVALSAAGHTFRPGSRLRLAVSPTYWPWMWPSPEPVTLEVLTGPTSAIELPLRTPAPDEGDPEHLVASAPPPLDPTGDGQHRSVCHDVVSGRAELVVAGTDRTELSDGLRLEQSERDVSTIVEGDPLSAHVRSERTAELTRGDWHVRIETVSTMSADATTFHLTNQLDAFESGTRVASRSWTSAIPRDVFPPDERPGAPS
jgi:uncharacterized protein